MKTAKTRRTFHHHRKKGMFDSTMGYPMPATETIHPSFVGFIYGLVVRSASAFLNPLTL
jgi:hypothetical protein